MPEPFTRTGVYGAWSGLHEVRKKKIRPRPMRSPGSGTLLGKGNYKLREPNLSIYRQIREPFSVGWVGMEAGFEIAAWG